VAVLKIQTKEELPFLVLGDDETMEIGDWVLAFGSPFGLNRSVTQGIISAKGRGLTRSRLPQEFLQTDAAINPGNSGGPLVNLRGEVIGINTAISTRSGGYDGVSLAIPASHAKWVANQLRNTGEVRRAYVGISMQELNADLAKAFNVKIPRGVVVTGVVKDSPAAQAGFQEGDERPHDLSNLENNDSEGGPDSNDEQSAELSDVGVSIQNLTADLASQLGLPSSNGVVITAVEKNSPADDVGLEAGMVISRVGNNNVSSIADVEVAMKKARQTGRALFLVKISRGNSSAAQFVSIELPDRN
jgi:serine protease Do